MRVIAGRLGGRTFNSSKGHRTHPMSDRIRGALFNTLGDIGGLTVLDAFAGSGALGFEALSRGASFVVAIEPDKSAQMTIENNTGQLGLGAGFKLIRAKAQSWLDTSGQTFDLVLCDPPYDNINDNLLVNLSERVKNGGMLVLSLPPEHDTTYFTDTCQLLRQKSYGDAELLFYRKPV